MLHVATLPGTVTHGCDINTPRDRVFTWWCVPGAYTEHNVKHAQDLVMAPHRVIVDAESAWIDEH